MKKCILHVFVLSALYSCNNGIDLSSYDKIDILISGGTVVDGKGNKAYVADIYIVGDSIVYVGNKATNIPPITEKVPAAGKVVSPGFIDLHAHGNPKTHGKFENFLAMGVTTITLGQDGSSPATERIKDWLDEVQEVGIGTNLAMFVGHGTLRNISGIGMKTDGQDSEITKMHNLLRENLKYCFGLSTGLEYTPGLNASQEELIELAKIVGEQDRMIMSHMRNEDDDQLISSIDELLSQGEHCRIHIAHIKSVYGKGKDRALEILNHIHQARKNGIKVTGDLYPYNASYTGISILFPKWAKTQEQFEIAIRDRRNELEEFLTNKVTSRNGPTATLLGSPPYVGKTLLDLESELGKSFEDILIEDIGPQGGSGAYFVMNEELQNTLMLDSLISICSDGSPTGFHPRGHGTFAKVVEEFVVKDSLLSLEEAVWKMTGKASEILGIADRGKISPGMKADILVFDPTKVRAKASYSDPHQLAEGFDVVIVNGKIARKEGIQSKTLNGRVLFPK